MHYGVGVVPARPYKPRDKAKVESGRAGGGALDHGRAAASQVLLARGTEPSHPRVTATSSTSGRSANGKARGRICSRALDKPRSEAAAGRALRPERMDARHASTSTITSRSTRTSTACRTTWCTKWWKSARRRRRSRSSTKAARGFAPAQPRPRADDHQLHEHRPRVTRRIWNGHPRGWCTGPQPSARTRRGCSSASWPTSRIRRWAIAPVWASSAWRRQYSAQRMEAAAERALATGACRYQSVKSILKNSLDPVPPGDPPPSSPPPPPHDNIRGAEYFD